MNSLPLFPTSRPRRLRSSENLRRLVHETAIIVDKMVMPFFVCEGKNRIEPINSMPGVSRFSLDRLIPEVEDAYKEGVRSVLLFGLPGVKDELASQAYDSSGIVQRAVRVLKKEFPDIIVVTDVCLCEYTDHGHCGFVKKAGKGRFFVDNDRTLELLKKTAVSHAEAGADIIAPSDMMDGRVKAIREALDNYGFSMTPIMSYAAKFASAFYGPFREAASSAPQFGDRRSYQMDPGNINEAIREVQLDIMEGADIIMVKPALAYLDVISRVKNKFNFPTAAYLVSGEYSMIKAAAMNGWLDEKRVFIEVHQAVFRAGADIIITYAAKELIKWLKDESNVRF